ncbi:MAG: hypothetical protein Tsb0013_18580 [Phycisphaerales bacterium]
MSAGPPIARFFEGVDVDAGPEALLGLEGTRPTIVSIREALQSRLSIVDRHPQGRSAEADEVRLALHVAAAQLADAQQTRGVDRPTDSERPREPIIGDTRMDPRRRTLLAVVAHSGGWNATARHRIGAVAHAMGISLETAIALIAGQPEPAAPTRRPEPGRGNAAAQARAPRLGASPVGRLLLGASALCMLCSLILLVTLIWVVSRGAGAAPVASSPTSAPARNAAVVPSPGAVKPSASAPIVDTPALVEAFGRVGMDAPSFEATYRAAAIGWMELEPGAFERLAFACAQAIADAGEARDALLAMVVDDARSESGVGASVFAAGVLMRVRGFDVLGASPVGRRARAVLDELPRIAGIEDDSIERGAVARLVTMAKAEDVPAGAWSDVGAGLALQMPAGARAGMTAVIDVVLRGEGDVTPREAEIVRAAVALRAWDRDDAALLLSWWSDDAIPVDRLSLLASELAALGVLGIGREIALDDASTPRDRIASGRALAEALGQAVEDPSRRGFEDAWVAVWRSLNADAAPALTDATMATRIASYARLNAAAALLWAGETSEAEAVLEDVSRVEEASRAPASRLSVERFTGPTAPPDGVWAARYLSARRGEEDRLSLLAELRAGGVIHGPADADVLARAALVGASQSVRDAAQRVVRGFSDDPYVLNGLLESLHVAAEQPDVSDLLSYVSGERLPSPDARGWRGEARRALGERFAVVVLGTRSARIDEAEEATREMYRLRIDPTVRAAVGDPAASDPLLQTLDDVRRERSGTRTMVALCDELWSRWHARAVRVPEGGWAPRTMASIERRRGARSAYGSGELQRFTLAQLSLAEVMAYQIASERPARASELATVLDACETAWRGADRVLEQVLIVERAMGELWAMRLDIDTARAGGS